MATLSASRRNSNASTTSSSPRPSISGGAVSRMSSLNEEEPTNGNDTDIIANSNENSVKESVSLCDEIVGKIEELNMQLSSISDVKTETVKTEMVNKEVTERVDSSFFEAEVTTKKDDLIKQSVTVVDKIIDDFVDNVSKDDLDDLKLNRMRICSERSDSGISDCSILVNNSGQNNCSCNTTPLLNKKFSINEEPEINKSSNNSTNLSNKPNRLNNNNSKDCVINNITNSNNKNRKIVNEIQQEQAMHASTINNSSTKAKDTTKVLLKSDVILKENKKTELTEVLKKQTPQPLDNKGQALVKAESVKWFNVRSADSVAKAVKKFDSLNKIDVSILQQIATPVKNSSPPPKSPSPTNQTNNITKPPKNPFVKIERTLSAKQAKNRIERDLKSVTISNPNSRANSPIRTICKLPSPSLTRKTQSVIAKEQCNERLFSKTVTKSDPIQKTNVSNRLVKDSSPEKIKTEISKPSSSPFLPRRQIDTSNKPKSESFKKAAAFWNSHKT